MDPIRITDEFVPDLGAPSFRVVAADWDVAIYYFAIRDQRVRLRFQSCAAYLYEGLNDEDERRLQRWPEDFEFHPFPQFLYVLEESDWHERLGLPSNDFHHYVLFFKENVFQCLAKGYVFSPVSSNEDESFELEE